jgi:DNA invertase Pin-like site-specific DNA recombinase
MYPDGMRAILYCRLSRKNDRNVPNLDKQEADLRALAERREWRIVDVIREVESSYDNIGGRPGFARLVDMVRSGACDVVAARHPDRFSRDDVESAMFRRDLEKAGVLMVTSHGDVDVASPAGAMMATITSAVATYESAVKRERLLRKHEQLAAAGRRSGGGTRGYGYRGPAGCDVVEAEAVVISEVARRLLAGCSINGEVSRLNAEAVPSATGGLWTRASLFRMMTSARISGRREHRGQITAVGTWPAIISPHDSDRLRAIAETNRRRPRRASRRYLLTGGLARCGVCQTALVAQPRDDGRRSYTCARGAGGCGKVRILSEPLEAWVAEAVAVAVDAGRLGALVTPADEASAAQAAARLRGIEERVAVLAVDFGRGLLPEAGYREALAVLDADRRAAHAEIDAVAAPDPLADVTDPLRDAWPALDVAQRRAVVERLVDAVVVSPAVKGRNRFDADRLALRWRA